MKRSTSPLLRCGAAALLVVLTLAGLLATSITPASAIPTTQILYSDDNGATWHTDITVAPGASMLVRVWYDNDTTDAISNSSVSTQIPAGFTLVPNTTRTCLAPDTVNQLFPTGNLECSTEAQQLGSTLDDSAIWSGDTLTVSPTAGLFGFAGDLTSGAMAPGRKAFLNLQQCGYERSGGPNIFSSLIPNVHSSITADTNVSNTADNAANCGNGNGGTITPAPGQTGVQNLSLLGNRFINLNQCKYTNTDNANSVVSFIRNVPNVNVSTGTHADNTAEPGTGYDCGGPPPGFPVGTAVTANQSFNILTNRYVNLHQCMWSRTVPGVDQWASIVDNTPSTGFRTGTNASDTPDTALDCADGANGYTLGNAGSGVLALDLLDRDRGEGYVQFRMTAPSPPETTVYPECGDIDGSGIVPQQDCGNITIEVAEVPLVALPVAGAAAVAAGGAWLAVRRHRKHDDLAMPTVAD